MINLANFDDQIINRKATALLVFTAEWCRPCLLQKPVIKNLREKFTGQVLIEVIDVDANAELADRFGARTLPTSVLFGAGEMIETLAGFQAEDFLDAYLQHILTNLQQQQSKA